MKHILLVEDNVPFAGAFAWLLEALPGLEIQVVSARSLAEARERLAEGAIDAALVDLVLPDGDGVSLIRETSPAVPRVPSLAITAWPLGEDTLAVVSRAGAEGLVDKLGSMQVIAEAIERLLSGEQPGRVPPTTVYAPTFGGGYSLRTYPPRASARAVAQAPGPCYLAMADLAQVRHDHGRPRRDLDAQG